jgi:hypothetical protein
MHDENVIGLARVGDQVTKAGEMLVEHGKTVAPVVVIGEDGRMVALSLGGDGIGIQMLAHLVYAVYVLPLGNLFKFHGRNVPTNKPVSFG